jgi:hypothetical protein
MRRALPGAADKKMAATGAASFIGRKRPKGQAMSATPHMLFLVAPQQRRKQKIHDRLYFPWTRGIMSHEINRLKKN